MPKATQAHPAPPVQIATVAKMAVRSPTVIPNNPRAKSIATNLGIKKFKNTCRLLGRIQKTKAVINEQRTRKNLAKRLGQHIRIDCNNDQVSIEGVYWTALKNDVTIPRLVNNQVCLNDLLDLLRNTQFK
jgi:hypothetical protein